MGLSGSGKSTFVRCLNRLIDPTAGSIHVDGTDITALSTRELRELRQKNFGMVFQDFALLPHRSVLENTVFGLEIMGVAKAVRHKKGMEALALVGLGGWENSFRTNCPAVCGNESASQGHWPSIRLCCSWMKRSARLIR